VLIVEPWRRPMSRTLPEWSHEQLAYVEPTQVARSIGAFSRQVCF
jgi:hypothetical protein